MTDGWFYGTILVIAILLLCVCIYKITESFFEEGKRK